MTNEQDPNQGIHAGDSAAGDPENIGDTTPLDPTALDPKTEALVISVLASLPPLEMPQDVHQRLLAAIEAEPNPYAAESTGGAPYESALPAQRNRRSSWFAGVAGIAAVSVLGLVIGTSVLGGESGPAAPITAAAIPMSATTNQYQKETFTQQVAAALPRWRSAAKSVDSTANPEPTVITSASPGAPNGTSTSSASPSPSNSLRVGRVDIRLREQVTACLSQISERAPMHVEIASYRATPTTPVEAIAVAAVSGANESVDVYAIKVTCADGDPQLVREHVTLHTK